MKLHHWSAGSRVLGPAAHILGFNLVCFFLYCESQGSPGHREHLCYFSHDLEGSRINSLQNKNSRLHKFFLNQGPARLFQNSPDFSEL
uniref:Uncharacterized protein n=1 Tax=Anguilla anguilla TaxID=7936 RepID=A0A0E9VND1_ANGAN